MKITLSIYPSSIQTTEIPCREPLKETLKLMCSYCKEIEEEWASDYTCVSCRKIYNMCYHCTEKYHPDLDDEGDFDEIKKCKFCIELKK